MRLMINLIVCAFLLPLFAVPSLAGTIILNKRVISVKKGFDDSWLKQVPSTSDTTWVHIPPQKKYRSIRIQDIPFPDKPARSFLSLKEYPPESYTVIASFVISDISDVENQFLGLFIDMIGENWAVYLNGKIIKDETHLAGNNYIDEYRTYRHVLVYLNPRLIKQGENIVGFKIIGDPTIPDTGFLMNTPIVIGDYSTLATSKMKLVPMMLVVVYLIAGLYHLVIFLFRRSERHNLYFGLFSIMLFIYFICRTSNVYYLIRDTEWTLLLEFCSLFSLFPLIMNYMELILFGRIRPFVIAYNAFCAMLIAATILVPQGTRIDLLRIWQYTAIIPLIYFMLFQMGMAFFTAVRSYRSSGTAPSRPGIGRALAHSFVNTVPGNLMIGALVTVGCSVFDVLDALYFSTGIVATNYGFLIFVFGVTFVLSQRFIYLYSEIDGLTVELRQKSSDLKETRVRYGISQEKYRLLVEGSSDIIFSLDEKFRFLTANRRMRDLVRLTDAAFGVKTIMEVLHETDQRSVTIQFIQNKLEQFIADKKPINLKMDFRTPFGSEPTSLQVRLEYINIEGRYEIFGRGTGVSEDMLSQYIEDEHQHYRIGNLMLVADDLSFRVTRNLEKFIDKREINLVRMAVREIIINAIEHGNLAITFDEKTRETVEGDYFSYINKRQNDPLYSGRTVDILYRVNQDRVEYTVTDQGSGFDYGKFLRGEVEVNDALIPHGRGITLAKNIFDELSYNDSGNSVVLVKHFKKSP